MSINYIKRNRDFLFENLNEYGIEKIQKYNPLFHLFFNLKNENANLIELNHKYFITSILEQIDDNHFLINCKNINDKKNRKFKKETFVKFSPIIDPLYYLMNRYGIRDNPIYLPTFEMFKTLYDNSGEEIKNKYQLKICNSLNSSYVDGFFYYLSSILFHQYNVKNAIDFYGSFLGIKNNFIYDIEDELSLVQESSFFHKNINNLFKLDIHIPYLQQTFKNKTPLKFDDSKQLKNNDLQISYNKFEDDYECNIFKEDTKSRDNDETVNETDNEIQPETQLELIYENLNIACNSSITNTYKKNNDLDMEDLSISSQESLYKISSDSNYSSDNNTDCEDDSSSFVSNRSNSISGSGSESGSESGSGSESETGTESGSGESDTDSESLISEDGIHVIFNKFPTNILFLEKLDGTLEDLIDEQYEDIKLLDKEWSSYFTQIVMTLIIFQKTFNLTHNDLHSNNVMYQEIEQKYLYYKLNNEIYRIPTHNKLLKIIDFGRAIYQYKNEIIMSDSFSKSGDANEQYNYGPFYNNKNPVIKPNPSFDLCRLGCSLYDNFEEEILKDCSANFIQTIKRWTTDDSGKNILYKNPYSSNPRERYPGFKLYKMITKTISHLNPQDEIKKDIYSQFIVSKEELETLHIPKEHIIDIDNLPKFYSS